MTDKTQITRHTYFVISVLMLLLQGLSGCQNVHHATQQVNEPVEKTTRSLFQSDYENKEGQAVQEAVDEANEQSK